MEPHALNLRLCFLTLHPKNIYIKKNHLPKKTIGAVFTYKQYKITISAHQTRSSAFLMNG